MLQSGGPRCADMSADPRTCLVARAATSTPVSRHVPALPDACSTLVSSRRKATTHSHTLQHRPQQQQQQ